MLRWAFIFLIIAIISGIVLYYQNTHVYKIIATYICVWSLFLFAICTMVGYLDKKYGDEWHVRK